MLKIDVPLLNPEESKQEPAMKAIPEGKLIDYKEIVMNKPDPPMAVQEGCDPIRGKDLNRALGILQIHLD